VPRSQVDFIETLLRGGCAIGSTLYFGMGRAAIKIALEEGLSMEPKMLNHGGELLKEEIPKAAALRSCRIIAHPLWKKSPQEGNAKRRATDCQGKFLLIRGLPSPDHAASGQCELLVVLEKKVDKKKGVEQKVKNIPRLRNFGRHLPAWNTQNSESSTKKVETGDRRSKSAMKAMRDFQKGRWRRIRKPSVLHRARSCMGQRSRGGYASGRENTYGRRSVSRRACGAKTASKRDPPITRNDT